MSSLARRYAKALLDIAREDNSIDQLVSELSAIEATLDESPELGATLFTPAVNVEDKRNITAAVLEKLNAGVTTRNFVGLLVTKGRLSYFREIRAEFARMADEATGKLRARVTSARELPDGLQKRITKKLGEATGKTVMLEVKVDPALLGGLIAEVGGVVYDASVRSQLQALQRAAKT